MGLRAKFTLIISLFMLMVALFVLNFVYVRIKNNADYMDEQRAIDGTQRAMDALENDKAVLISKLSDWARWDDTYQFAKNRNEDYVKANLGGVSLSALGINFSIYLNADKEVVISRAVDASQEKLVGIKEEYLAWARPDSPLLNFKDKLDAISGYVGFSDGTYLIAAMPILNSERTSESSGVLIWGYRLDEGVIQRLNALTHQKLELSPIGSVKDLSEKKIWLEATGENQVVGHAVLLGVDDQPLRLLRVIKDRPLHAAFMAQKGRLIAWFFIVYLVLIGLMIFLLDYFLIRRFVVIRKALRALNEGLIEDGRVPEFGNDELTLLSKDLNAMLEARSLLEFERLSINSELQQSKLALETKIVEMEKKTQELQASQQQIVHLQKMEAIGQLASGVAHDFNNLLAGILGYASILKLQLKDQPKMLEKLNVIEQSAKRGAQLTKSLLGFARKGDYHKDQISLNKVVEEACVLLVKTIPKEISFSINLDPFIKYIEADSTQMLQVVMNLVLNAKDALSDHGEIRIATKNVMLDEAFCVKYKSISPGDFVCLTVADNGPGIPKSLRDKIFDPFFTTKPKDKGTGLGLAMVDGIMQSHGGLIQLDDTVNDGAAFNLYLPAINALLLPTKTAEAAPKARDLVIDVKEVLRDKVILAADDEPNILTFYQEVLQPLVGHIYLASDGAQAIEFAKTHQGAIDLFLFDVIMPWLNGIQVHRKVRELYPETPTIFSSGYAESKDVKMVLKESRVFFIQKPLQGDQLISFLAEALVASVNRKN